MQFKTASLRNYAHSHDPVPGERSSSADRGIEIEAGPGSGTLSPTNATRARAPETAFKRHDAPRRPAVAPPPS
ncbi:hypothetical protein, partial [Xanthomonas graminis]|uniref:hypothetical protein n=1 Tax=Xanthomonas graminis TaxID=3390026 RepID=UPI0020148CF0